MRKFKDPKYSGESTDVSASSADLDGNGVSASSTNAGSKNSRINVNNNKNSNNDDDDDDDDDDKDEPDSHGIYSVKTTEATEHLIAHILATKTHAETVTEASMEIPDLDEHHRVKDPKSDNRGHRNDGRTLAVHSVVVDPAYQGQSIGSIVLKDYIQRMTTLHVADRISILVHDRLMPFYKLQGFQDLGPSHCEFSGGNWYDMSRPFSDSDDDY